MSAPNPLIPQGTFQAQAAKGASNVRLAVATIVAIHIVFFGGLLLQGCKRDPKLAEAAPETNATSLSNLSLEPINSNSLYYASGGLPSDGLTSTAQPEGAGNLANNNAESLWQSSNLVSAGVGENASERVTSTKEYTIAKGDTMGRIAQRNNTTVSAIRKANPGVEPTRIRPGQKINLPVEAQTPVSAKLSGTQATPSANGASANIYTVKSGDSLTKIANLYKTTVRELTAANNLQTSRINIGQKLKIPAPSQPSAAALPTNVSPNPVF
ncbi:MAG: LysM peptidoglycan-binding domain-containing protein [Limisphaerales bacterium]